MQRLYLATRWRSGRGAGDVVAGQPAPLPAGDAESVACALAAEAAALGPEATKAAVGADLAAQALAAARAMHAVYGGGGDRQQCSGSDLAASFAAAHGHALAARPSSIPGAGAGVFVEAATPLPPGTLVAFYPGAAYPPLTHRALPGYPQVDRGGAFLMARYDGTILDAAAWGRGAGDACGAPLRDREGGGANPVIPGPAAAAVEAALGRGCDPRNPLALGHLANHPPPGGAPNVMAAAVDVVRWAGSVLAAEPWLRRYLPVAVCGEEEEGKHGEEEARGGGANPPAQPTPLPLLALVAVRPLPPGTELLLNYRLSPHLAKPDWYAAVDEDEDARRWA